MDQRKPRPIYRSKGVPAKVNRLYQILIGFTLAAGLVMLILPLISSAPGVFSWLGVLYLAVALLLSRWSSSMKRCRLYVFEDSVAGVSCFYVPADAANSMAARKTSSADVKFKFYFDEITNVEKGPDLYSQILITAHGQKHTIVVNSNEKAYNILCDYVYGPMGSRECIACGAPIGATAETCAHCGHMTRYGKNNTIVKAREKDTKNNMIINGIAIAVGIIGLFIFIPALIDFNKIRTYGSLYTSFYPDESKKIVFKLLAGFFVTLFGFSYPVSNMLINKLQGK